MGGPLVLLICETWPLPRLRLKVCITAEPCVGTTISPFEEGLYLVLHAIKKPIATRTSIAPIQVNLVRILRFISCERTDAFPGRPKPGMNAILRREWPSIYVSGMRGKSKPLQQYWNHENGWRVA